MKRTSTFAALFLILALSCSVAPAQKKAPNFSFTQADGKTFELAKQNGKVVVINFWATWCGPCRKEIPGFLEVYEQYKSKGLEIVGISLDRTGWQVVRPYIEKTKITYPVVIGDNDVVDAYGGIEAIPTTFFVNRKGELVKSHFGYMSKDDLEQVVKPLL